MKSADFASRWRGRLVTGRLHFHTPCVFVVMRHVSRLTAEFKICKSGMIVRATHLRAATVGVQVCFSLQFHLTHHQGHNLLPSRTTLSPVPSSTCSVPGTPSWLC